jgi:hypothetical protein
MRQDAGETDSTVDFRTMVLACAQMPQVIARFNREWNCRLSAPLDELIDDEWLFDLEQPDAEARARAAEIAAFIVFVHTTVWQPYVERTSRSCSMVAM